MATIVTLQDKDGNTIYPVTSPTALTGGILPIANGGTNASTAADARANLGAQATHIKRTATLAVASWATSSPYTQTVSVTSVTASNTVIVSPAPSSYKAWVLAGVYCSAQASGTLTFTAYTSIPTTALTANIVILN